MSFAMQKLRALLPGQRSESSAAAAALRHSVVLEPEIGFQITIETSQPTSAAEHGGSEHGGSNGYARVSVPELNVHLLAARHLPTLFGFKIVQGYLIKVKLFPGSKRLDSSIQTNSWPKFNENFKFPLAPDIKPSLKHTPRRSSQAASEVFAPEELFAGQFVVFTVYALLELPPASFNRFNKTYRSLRDKSTNFVQKVIESSSSTANGNATKDEAGNGMANGSAPNDAKKSTKQKKSENARDAMPPLTISESRRNIGSVTCYLESKLFKRNPRTGLYATEELWLPIKDITTTVTKGPTSSNNNNNLTNAPKGVVELALELRDLSEAAQSATTQGTQHANDSGVDSSSDTTTSAQTDSAATPTTTTNGNVKWQRMTSEVKRKMGISNASNGNRHNLVLRVTTARMRCSNKVKDELEANAGSVYVKTTVFEHGIYIDAWKSGNFYPSLSTKWDMGTASATMEIPLQSLDTLENIFIRTTLATKTKMGKKLVLGTVLVGVAAPVGTGTEQMQLLRESALNERVAMWHQYQ